MLITTKRGDALLGNLDISTETATVGYDGKAGESTWAASCRTSSSSAATPRRPYPAACARSVAPEKIYDDQWRDLKVGDDFPASALQALDRYFTAQAWNDGLTTISHYIVL